MNRNRSPGSSQRGLLSIEPSTVLRSNHAINSRIDSAPQMSSAFQTGLALAAILLGVGVVKATSSFLDKGDEAIELFECAFCEGYTALRLRHLILLPRWRGAFPAIGEWLQS